MTQTRRQRTRSGKTSKVYLEGFNLLLYLMGTIVFLEIILRINTEVKLLSIGMVYSVLFGISTALLIYLLASLLKGTFRTILMGVILFVVTLLFSSQFIYYKIFKTFYTLYSAGNGAQVMEFMNDILTMIRINIFWLILIFAPFILYIVLKMKSRKSHYRFTWPERGLTIGLFVLIFGVALIGIKLGDKDQNSPYDMYYNNNYPVASVDSLGLVTSMRLDLQRTVFGFNPTVAPPPPIVNNPTNTPTEPVETAISETPVEAPVVYEDNTMDIDFEKLIAEAKNDELKNMHTYFSTKQVTKKNEKTGIYEGYNLILITAEAFSRFSADKDVTPTLYKMLNEGYHFTNFYNPIWGVSTSDGEYVATTGLIPKSGVWSMYKSGSISMPFAMGNQLKNLGYKTLAYHNHTYNYYKRDISHPNLGYTYKGLGNGLEVKKTWPESDLEMMQLTTDEYIGSEPFHAYYMTVSGHMFYSNDGNFIARKNRDLVTELPYNAPGKAYMATQIELDKALEYLMKKLEEAGVADKTLIAISADHYPYGLEKVDIDNLAGHEVESNFELYKSDFILYTEGMEPETIDRPVSSLDIIPTISNLLGLDYDSRLLMGVDMFSDTDPLVIFNNRSFITDKGKYNAVTKAFIPNEGVSVDDNYRKAISDEIDRKFYYSAKILETDYYAKVLAK
ncbi:MAG: sulfatase-like hydrolase/transferase [Clostridiaceae bacterium]